MHAKYPLRPLWIGLSMHQMLFDALGTQLFEKYTRKIVELGYNALILGGFESEQTACRQQIAAIGPALIQRQITCILLYRPSQQSSPVAWFKEHPFANYMLWISQASAQSNGDRNTLSERIQEEMKAAEKILGHRIPLIFYLPFDNKLRGWRNPRLFTDLCLAAGKDTTLAFASKAGHLGYDHLPTHPFLKQLRMHSQRHSTPLLPILNAGGLYQGEGLWPALCFDLFEFPCMQELAHQCAGFVSVACRWPEKGEFLECNLWVAGQLQWPHTSPDALIEAWCRVNYPKADYQQLKSLLQLIRNSVLELSQMRYLTDDFSCASEDKEVLLEYLQAALKVICLKSDKDACTSLKAQIHQYLQEANQILLAFSA